jgi:hypothetical protein
VLALGPRALLAELSEISDAPGALLGDQLAAGGWQVLPLAVHPGARGMTAT